jgi:hypothetical protein
MELQHFNVKFYVDGDLNVEPDRLIEVFHEWVKRQSFDELLIDVADYWHVPAGPGILLMGLEADYGMDNTDNRFGLRYNRKAAIEGGNDDRVAQALRSAASACRLLEEAFNGVTSLRFSRSEIEMMVNDRALAPNTGEGFEAVKSEVDSVLAKTLGHNDFSIEHASADEPRRRLTLSVRTDKPFDLDAFASI